MYYDDYSDDYIGNTLKKLSGRRIRAAIYCRCSTEKEVQMRAIETQLEELLDEAGQKGWEVVHIYRENETGTGTDYRFEYMKMLEDMEEDKFDIVFAKDTDRLMRDNKTWFNFVDSLTANGKLLYTSLSHEFYDPDRDELLYGIKMTQSAEYSRNLSKKIARAHRTRQRECSSPNITGNPYGWIRVDKNTFIINEAEAGYIKQAYELLREGKGFYSISNIMYSEGVRSRNAGKIHKCRNGMRKMYSDKISAAGWRDILLNPRMYGTVIMNTEHKVFKKNIRRRVPEEEWIYYENALPPIVSYEYYEETMKMYRERTSHCPIREHKRDMDKVGRYLLSGKVICACCGNVYYRIKTKSGIKWKCSLSMKSGSKACENIVVQEETFRKAIYIALEKTYGVIADAGGLISEVTEDIGYIFNNEDDELKINELEMQIFEEQNKKSVLMEKLMGGIISDRDYTRYNDKLERNIKEMESKLDGIKSVKATYINYNERLDKIRTFLSDKEVMGDITADVFIKCMKEIVIHKDYLCRCIFDRSALKEIISVYTGMTDNMNLTSDLEFVYRITNI